MDWREEPISASHDRIHFDCGSSELNEYLSRFARQNHLTGGAKTFVAVPPNVPTKVLGYYSIAPGSVEFRLVPPEMSQRLGRYPVPVYRLARLAVDRSVQGQGLGSSLLFAAASRAILVAEQVGGMALLIDAKDDTAARWYMRFGAVPLLDSPLTLMLPLATVARAISTGRTR